jgi:beta-lactam-binding protein with PASTA domain
VAQAEAVLSAKGLQLGNQTEEQNKGVGAGIILAQDPLPGQEVDLGAYVNITVTPTAEGAVKVEEPVKNKPEEEKAKEAAEKEPAKPEPAKGGFRLWW